MATVDTPTLAWPVSISDGTYSVVEADSLEAVTQSVSRICQLELGELPDFPNLGLPSFELRSTRPSPGELQQLIESQEPRAAVTVNRVPQTDQGLEGLDIAVGLAGEAS
ncbi:hypothetical protein [Patulibacter minatonensis]|uniref:hypothetical protein n=1 Tax=Patulibacter minatonensis TaxID=298163 RepID=UPI0012FC2DA1|nr:hypothetical protein [Patulibacter minatonensis]